MGTLPPVLRYRFPFNYVSCLAINAVSCSPQIIMLLFPIMLPIVVLLM